MGMKSFIASPRSIPLIERHATAANTWRIARRHFNASLVPRAAPKKPQWVMDLERDAEHDPDIAKIIDGANGDPNIIRARMRAAMMSSSKPVTTDEMISEPSGVDAPPSVKFREIDDYSNMWIWMEFHEYPNEKDRENFEEALKAFFIVGRLGGYNSLNLQLYSSSRSADLSYYTYESKKHDEDTLPAMFHEMGDLEWKGRWSRFFLDMGTSDELAFDVLINLLSGFSKDFVAMKQICIGGQNDDWKMPPRESRLERMFGDMKELNGLMDDEQGQAELGEDVASFRDEAERDAVLNDPRLQPGFDVYSAETGQRVMDAEQIKRELGLGEEDGVVERTVPVNKTKRRVQKRPSSDNM